RDAVTGLATGKRRHSPVVITREPGPASPQFFQALVHNEVLSSVAIQVLRGTGTGMVEPFEVISLQNARVSEFRQYVGDDGRLLEDIGVAFQQIQIENKPGAT